MKKRQLINILLIFLFYLVLIFFFSTSGIFFALIKGGSPNIWEDFGVSMARWLPWAFFTPFIIFLVRRFPIDSKHWKKSVPIHIFACLLFSFLQTWVYYIYYLNVSWQKQDFKFISMMLHFFKLIHFNIITYWVTVGVCYLLDFYKKFRDRELRASRLENQLSQSQLAVLKMQLHPHFLFNTLHAISALVYKKPKEADWMISRLSDLLRMSLESTECQEVPLQEELEFLNVYLEIEQTRFQDRLKIKQEIDPKTLDILVPNLILQPLVENAIRHGIAPRKEGGLIKIQSNLQNEKLIIYIDDNGRGFPDKSEKTKRNGIGLTNTRERLMQLYGDQHQFVVRNGSTKGVLVILEIPARRANLDCLKKEEN